MTTHTDLDPTVLDVDALECFGWRLTQENHEAWFSWAVHDHPVLQRIRTLADRGVIPDHRTYDRYRAGTALAQTVTSDEARSLAEHFARVWELPQVRPVLTPASAGQTVPGGVLGYLYGVEITVEDPVRVVAEARSDGGPEEIRAIMERLLPPGTREDVTAVVEVLTPEAASTPELVQRARRSIAEQLGRPHILMDLSLERLVSEAEQVGLESPLEGLEVPGYRALCGATLHAIPGRTTHLVVRAAPSLTDAGAWVRGDWDGQWIEQTDPACEVMQVPIVYEEVRRSAATPQHAAVTNRTLRHGNGFARPTGRIEVRQDGTVAEVYEVPAP